MTYTDTQLRDEMSADDVISHSQQVTQLVNKYLKSVPAMSADERARVALAAGSAVMNTLTKMYIE